MSRVSMLVLCMLSAALVFAMEDPPVPKAEPEPSPSATNTTTNSSSPALVKDNYDRFNLEEDLAKEAKEAMEHTTMHMSFEDSHLQHVPLTPGELLPAYDVSNSSSSNDSEHEVTTKKTFIMKIPVATKSPMMDAMANKTDGDMMMKDEPHKTTSTHPSSSSQLVGQNSTMKTVTTKNSSTVISSSFIVALLAMLASQLVC